jgi:hypothetical protein
MPRLLIYLTAKSDRHAEPDCSSFLIRSRSFEDQVEHAKQLRCFGPSLELEEVREGLYQNSRHKSGTSDKLCMAPLIRHISGLHSQKYKSTMTFSLRKEVIQPQVLLRLPCYDFTPIMNYTLEGCSLAVSSPASSATHFRDVTGGVYKARERIHRGILIRDY